ncbi:MAG TPA: hypothetical protein PKI02_04075 [Mycobacterium sp.]|nr:hypothetical protein [Mycolicibacterium sp.]HNM10601.1 hypothetical protein [Mycobacterium sp.]
MTHPTDENSEDVGSDEHVASSRAGKGGTGTYVGETDPDDAIDAGETGAEARSQAGGQ